MPIMLNDGSVVDSARLPANAVQERPVVMSQSALYQSIHMESSPPSTELTSDETDFQARQAREEYHPLMFPGQQSSSSSEYFAG